MAKVSFIIPTYNNFYEMSLCLKSILNLINLNKKSYEIIIVDDGSNISNFTKLKNYILNIKKKNINLLRIKKNKGPAYARNFGAKKAKFEYLFFLDSDTQISKNMIFYFLKQIKKYDAVVGTYHYKPINSGLFQNHKALFNYFYFTKKGVKPYETFHSACAGIKKKIFFKVGGYNPNIKWGMDYENEDLGRRIIKKYSMILDPKIQVFHNFPNAINMTKLYFIRVRSWIYNFLDEKKFETTGTATASMAVGSIISSFLFLFFFIYLITDNKQIENLLFINLILYTIYYLDFFYFVFKKNIIYLPSCFFINIYINLVVSLSAFIGFCNKLVFVPIFKKQ